MPQIESKKVLFYPLTAIAVLLACAALFWGKFPLWFAGPLTLALCLWMALAVLNWLIDWLDLHDDKD